MKTLKGLLGVLILFTNAFGQSAFIDFSSPTDLIEIDTTNPNNVWQIGRPQKTFLNSALSGDFAIITDTVNTYPNNNTSSFILKVPEDIRSAMSTGVTTGELNIFFSTKYQTDSLADFGRIEFSADSGDTWHIMESEYTDTSFSYWHQGWNVYTPGGSGWYMDKDTFTGQSAGWEQQRIRLLVCSVSHPKQSSPAIIGCFPKSLWLRFRFISDSTSNNLDGWAIDNISMEVLVYVGIQERKETNVLLFPNPASDKLTLLLPSSNTFKTVAIRDIIGNIIHSELTKEEKVNFSVSTLPEGIYYLTVGQPEDNKTYSRKLVIIH